MATNLKSKKPPIFQKKGERWFILSYDADGYAESKAKDDFRKEIIRVLRSDVKIDNRVIEIKAIVESTIMFKDPNKLSTLEQKFNRWAAAFRELEIALLFEFDVTLYFIVAPLIHDESENAYVEKECNSSSQSAINRFLKAVINEEKERFEKKK